MAFYEQLLGLINELEQKQLNVEWKEAKLAYVEGRASALSRTQLAFRAEVLADGSLWEQEIDFGEELTATCSCGAKAWCSHKLAALLQAREAWAALRDTEQLQGHVYTRSGMIKRVLAERKAKSKTESYSLALNTNVFGPHSLQNQRGEAYTLSLHNFKHRRGYCSCPDYQYNKLGTCKHLGYVFDYLAEHESEFERKKYYFPYIEIFLDPLNDYRISWFYPHQPDLFAKALIDKYFGNRHAIDDEDIPDMVQFFHELAQHELFMVRPEVYTKLEAVFNEQALLQLEATTDFGALVQRLFGNKQLLPYQLAGVQFIAFREGAILADEMGLGKSSQAVVAALVKRELLHFRKNLIVCTVSLRSQWAREIARWTNLPVLIAENKPAERREQLANFTEGFFIASYETVVKDINWLAEYKFDFAILDEAQRIKDYESKTAWAIKRIVRKHALVLTATPIENRLIDLYSIVDFVDKRLLAPLWEFSYQHCSFLTHDSNEIVGYYRLDKLRERIQPILLRRLKSEVLAQLPQLKEIPLPVSLLPEQVSQQNILAYELLDLLQKGLITHYDNQRIYQYIGKMRQVANSLFLLDSQQNISAKLSELEHILAEKLDLKNHRQKVIVVTEWKKLLAPIAHSLRSKGLRVIELNSDHSSEKRSELLQQFSHEKHAIILVLNDAVLEGLDLHEADSLINFDIPTDELQRSRRLASIQRIESQRRMVTVLNLVATHSIEEFLYQQPHDSLFDQLIVRSQYSFALDASNNQFVQRLQAHLQSMLAAGKPEQPEPAESSELAQMLTHTQAAINRLFEYVQQQNGKLKLHTTLEKDGLSIHLRWHNE